ncbi:energy-coupled thiamine transporter ThiT [Anaerophilus nitritogenes]|uniref:energy-coupled thiamine transporter ThiT n=1 Tax=Anaerophilus nitritogenes TaxID=2498136 RepID=UPI00101B861C|nr:energy-coupled thiamine transporter ThiT [Anaerophilus nitritogenes]
MRKFTTKMIVEAGIMIALAQILSYIKIFEAPYGGSITAGSMVPIFIYSIIWGCRPGILAGVVYGILQFLLGKSWSLHILSIVFDYIAAFGVLGLAGLLNKNLKRVNISVCIATIGRFISHVISGAIVFKAYAPAGENPWIYSIKYNASYLVPELIISIFIIGILYRPLKYQLSKN